MAALLLKLCSLGLFIRAKALPYLSWFVVVPLIRTVLCQIIWPLSALIFIHNQFNIHTISQIHTNARLDLAALWHTHQIFWISHMSKSVLNNIFIFVTLVNLNSLQHVIVFLIIKIFFLSLVCTVYKFFFYVSDCSTNSWVFLSGYCSFVSFPLSLPQFMLLHSC